MCQVRLYDHGSDVSSKFGSDPNLTDLKAESVRSDRPVGACPNLTTIFGEGQALTAWSMVSRMADSNQLRLLNSGIWDAWRRENSHLIPDLSKANLKGTYF